MADAESALLNAPLLDVPFNPSEKNPNIGRVNTKSNSYISPSLSQPTAESHSSNPLEAVVIVRFDNTVGNIIDWIFPEWHQSCFDGLEFKAIVSGAHSISSDYVLFRVTDSQHSARLLYGIAAFERVLLADDSNSSERHARMISFCVLSRDYFFLKNHLPSLSSLSLLYGHANSNLGRESVKKQLLSYFSLHCSPDCVLERPPKEIMYRSAFSCLNRFLLSSATDCGEELLQFGPFSQFVKYFGASIFSIWKALVLRKRVMFYSRVPVGPVCERVALACLLLQHTFPMPNCNPASFLAPNTLFYVSLSDISTLSSVGSYVAATCDVQFYHRPDLWDVFCYNQDVIVNPKCHNLLSLTSSDRNLYSQLGRLMQRREEGGDDMALRVMFVDLNDRLHRLLDEAHQQSLLQSRGFVNLNKWDEEEDSYFSQEDSAFIRHVCDMYNLSVRVQVYFCCLCTYIPAGLLCGIFE